MTSRPRSRRPRLSAPPQPNKTEDSAPHPPPTFLPTPSPVAPSSTSRPSGRLPSFFPFFFLLFSSPIVLCRCPMNPLFFVTFFPTTSSPKPVRASILDLELASPELASLSNFLQFHFLLPLTFCLFVEEDSGVCSYLEGLKSNGRQEEDPCWSCGLRQPGEVPSEGDSPGPGGLFPAGPRLCLEQISRENR